ncbi:ligase-associated DNA damage response endonuclease PdeM [Rhodohalobacter mucosus]|uniref:Ligase-associated DNA damage response endonuclease PdeM n=1 Tax=Rhodohalobacter mucosus TaxID=2079485 RepID=A0A316TLG0_9BACT|nr:ligase-associated DNA damage response endonuclease PdeM [Rhodohalobacter mucosus]PWN05423.1 ligase-associated DNA damage response endonuclease PdeM [Rhodohalobacter mucosus]
MSKTETISIAGQTWILHPEKCVFWNEERTLILTDIHLGKSGHFRKSGIAAPGILNSKNLNRMAGLLREYKPERILILGDLFHSTANRDWLEFEEWLATVPDTRWLLVTGNHDSLHSSFYESAGIETTPEWWSGPFYFIHDEVNAAEHTGNGQITVSGHIHPGISLKGKGRQAVRLPCFLFSEGKKIVLPAFGEFTGLKRIHPDETDRVFAVVEEQVIQIKT